MARLLGMLSIFVLLVLRPGTAADTAPSCSTTISKLAPCLSYIEGSSSQVPGNCCAGVKDILGEAKSKPDKQAVCNCIKSTLAKLGKNIDPGRVSALPKKCGLSVNLPPIDKNYDCSKMPASAMVL